jgi:hypothetical protein
MKRFAIITALVALAATSAFAAKFEDKDLKLSIEAPAGFTKQAETPQISDRLGEHKAIYVDTQEPKRVAFMLVHHMELPEGADYAIFKQQLPDVLKEYLGNSLKLNRQEDTEVGKFSGFMVDFEGPGDGKLPTADGTFRHHVRWYLLRDGDKKLVGLIYHSLEDAWKDLEPKVQASIKSAKKTD